MSEKDSEYIEYDAWRGEGIANMRTEIYGGPDKGAPIPLIVAFKQMQADVAALSTPPPATVDIPALVAALRPELEAAAEAAVRKVLGAVDGATPAS